MSRVRRDGVRSGVMERVLPKTAIKLRTRDAKPTRRLGFVACAFAQCLFDRLSLEALQIRTDERRRIVAIRQRQVLGTDWFAVAENRRSLDHVAKLAHIPWPVIGEQGCLGVGCEVCVR